MKHTPGPWVVIEKTTSVGKCFRVGPHEIVTENHGGICLYDDRTQLNPHSAGEQEANARLIAAAPDLLKALEEAVECLEDSSWYKGEVAVWKHLISKVKGDKP